MEQQFQLKYHGNLSIIEQSNMTAEDRAWWMQRLEKEFKDKADRERNQISSAPKPRIPSRSSTPRR